MTILRIDDITATNSCHDGARKIAKDLGIDWWDFLQHGIDIERIKHIDDVNVQNAIQMAITREKENSNG